jgi:hypothetical protein
MCITIIMNNKMYCVDPKPNHEEILLKSEQSLTLSQFTGKFIEQTNRFSHWEVYISTRCKKKVDKDEIIQI